MQNSDGGWGFHIESHSTMLCTAFNYITLRLLGENSQGCENTAISEAQRWILDHGGLTMIPSWGKMSLAVSSNSSIIGLYTLIFIYLYFYLFIYINFFGNFISIDQ